MFVTPQAKILVVDDTPRNVKLLADVLGVKGYAVVTAASGPEALEQIEKEKPDLVLLDVMMPGMSGYEVCQKIRENPDTILLPVVIVTATSIDPNQDRVKGLEAGADDFLTKPINQPELFARVRSLLRIEELHKVVKDQAAHLAELNKELEGKLVQEASLAEVGRSLGDVGHDVKNMLMPVITGAELLDDELNDFFGGLSNIEAGKVKASQKMCKEIIEMLRNNAWRIQERVKEIAGRVKGLSNPPQFGSCQVENVVASIVQNLGYLARKKGISLCSEGLDALPVIQADERRLFNAFYNLINNAIPEVPAGGSITVRGFTEPEATDVVMSVVDTGRGMPPDVRASLFTSRVVSQKAGGTGLGTKIVKDVVDLHGGSITVESEEGVGTTFHLRLPIDGPTFPNDGNLSLANS